MQRILILLSALLCLHTFVEAQDKEYMYEVGAGIGTCWGYGDNNHGKAFSDQGLSANLQLRYNANLRWALAWEASSNKVFDGKYWQLAFRPEISFWNYGWGSDYREKHRLAPFLTAGLGLGVVSGYNTNNLCCALPLGIGMKWKLAPRWNAQLTALFTKTFSDAIDNVEDPYKVGTKAPMNTDWIGSIVMSLTFDFKERCVECKNQNSF